MRRYIAAVAAAALVGVGMVASSSLPAQALTFPVDIRVEHDLNFAGSGPRVLEVSGVVPAAGPEITIANEIENPSSWGGNVLVDIDPDAQTITVQVESQNCYSSVLVEITTPDITSVTTIADAIFAPGNPVAVTTSVAGGVVTLSWASAPGTCPSLGAAGSQSVFTYQESAAPEASLAPAVVTVGDPVTVAGTRCPDSPVEVLVVPEAGGDPVIEDEALGDEDGDWSYEIDTSDLEPGAYEVLTSCILVDGPGFDYEVLAFDVSAGPVVAPPTVPVVTPPAVPVVAPAAVPVVADPSFTG